MTNDKTIKIDPEFKALIPPLSEDERGLLEQSIASDGVRDALSVWDRDGEHVLLDGHNRYDIATAKGLPFCIVPVAGVSTRDDALVWIIKNQLGRRNLDAVTRVELAMRMHETLKAQAKANQKVGGKAGADMTNRGLINRANPVEPTNTRDRLAEIAGVSGAMVERITRTKKNGVPELVEAVRSGSVSAVAGDMLSRLPQEEQRAVLQKGPDAVRAKSGQMQKAKPEPMSLDDRIKAMSDEGIPPSVIAKDLGIAVNRVHLGKRKTEAYKRDTNPLSAIVKWSVDTADALEIATDTASERWAMASDDQRCELMEKLNAVVSAVLGLMEELNKEAPKGK